MLSSPLWCGCGGGNGFIPPCGVAVVVVVVVVVMVSSTPCCVAVVVVMVVVLVTRLQGHVKASPPVVLWPEPCGLPEGSYEVHSVCRWFTSCYPTPLWFCGLWPGPCSLHEVYGLFIEGFLTVYIVFRAVHTRFHEGLQRGMACKIMI